MDLLVIFGVVAWLVPTLAGIWFLAAFKEMRDEIKTIRRYLQAIHDQQKR
ncbi:MAG TPA: hypothetical protein VNT75_24840 [Symbiobacteriaceae bacterium]|nr:hypothetical protein [Symbiobacteriaceae bacterium]